MHSFAFSILQSIAVYVCTVKCICRLYLVLTKLTLTNWKNGLKRFLAKKLQTEDNTQANNKKMAELTIPVLVGALRQPQYEVKRMSL